MNIQTIIGDDDDFFSDLYQRMCQVNIDISGMPLSHLLYRTVTEAEYTTMRDQLCTYCSSFVETQFNGRSVSVLCLKEPLQLQYGFEVSVIELPAPRQAHMYPSGLESIGVVIGSSLGEFNQQHHKALSGVKDHGVHCQPSFITFDNDKTAKFYDIPLTEIVLRQGWRFESTIHQ